MRHSWIVACWFSLKWKRGRSLLVSEYSALGGGFQGIRVYRSDEDLEAAQGTGSSAAIHRLDEPTTLSFGMIASRRARFRFARQDHCNSTTSIARWRIRPGRLPPRLVFRAALSDSLSRRSSLAGRCRKRRSRVPQPESCVKQANLLTLRVRCCRVFSSPCFLLSVSVDKCLGRSHSHASRRATSGSTRLALRAGR
jgi:hypothetical protein